MTELMSSSESRKYTAFPSRTSEICSAFLCSRCLVLLWVTPRGSLRSTLGRHGALLGTFLYDKDRQIFGDFVFAWTFRITLLFSRISLHFPVFHFSYMYYSDLKYIPLGDFICVWAIGQCSVLQPTTVSCPFSFLCASLLAQMQY